MSQWNADEIPDQTGRVFVVTGANAGLGFEATRALAARGAHVVMACRNRRKAEAARESLGRELAAGTELRTLDLGDLASVRAFADGLAGQRIDVLVNNAGLMVAPQGLTADGHELQWGTNVLGPFLLTALLMPGITDRVVWLSSHAHRGARIHLEDPDGQHRHYRAFAAYGQSKLADLVLAVELQRRLSAKGSAVRSMAAHPGYAATQVQPKESIGLLPWARPLLDLSRVVAQPAAMGALPELYAATVTDLPGGSFVGPDGFGELAGHPVVVGTSRAAHDPELGRELWALCERQTGTTFEP